MNTLYRGWFFNAVPPVQTFAQIGRLGVTEISFPLLVPLLHDQNVVWKGSGNQYREHRAIICRVCKPVTRQRMPSKKAIVHDSIRAKTAWQARSIYLPFARMEVEGTANPGLRNSTKTEGRISNPSRSSSLCSFRHREQHIDGQAVQGKASMSL